MRIFDSPEAQGLSLRECILRDYGKETFNLSRKYDSIGDKLVRCKNDIIFNLRCKKKKIIPQSLRLGCPIATTQARKIIEKAGHSLVKERLRIAEKRKEELVKDQEWMEIGMRRRMGDERFEAWRTLVNKKHEKTFIATRSAQQSKMDKLIEERMEASSLSKKVRSYLEIGGW